MFVISVQFFNTYSRGIMFITSLKQYLKIDLIMQAMKSIKAYYTKRGFKIVKLRAYQKLEPAQVALTDM